VKVNLYFPDLAIDEDGNQGFWTKIYNEVRVLIHYPFQKTGKLHIFITNTKQCY